MSAPEVICAIIVNRIEAGYHCPAVILPSGQGTMSPQAVVSVTKLNKYLKNQRNTIRIIRQTDYEYRHASACSGAGYNVVGYKRWNSPES